MPIRSALTNTTVKRFVALTAAYVLILQALFGAGAQLRVMLAEAPGLCTILGFKEPGQPKHALDACSIHCVGHAAQDIAGLAGLGLVLAALCGWSVAQNRTGHFAPRPAFALHSRGPPR